MKAYKYSEARQNLATVLNVALQEEVLITRKDGNTFKLVAINKRKKTSPLDLKGINTAVNTGEIINVFKKSRAGRNYFN
ncbi:MAG: prevent-host-death protein [Candidatus Margulisbacteria bacterium]|jgi:antitoxin (DNA-binding transcriptional repressor) of toxin-antitoxin stability system|nr:prevent-host-death protein [Candidatus Margulisiibacteriota bacterium]